MIGRFLSLEWKAFFRSANFGKSIGIKIVMGLFALYMITMFLSIGFFLDKILKESFPDSDVLEAFNSIIFYWILTDLVIRFFFQKLPVMHVKPLLVLPIKRKTIVNYVLCKSAVSFINFLPLFAIIPFGAKLIYGGYDVATVLVWMCVIVILTLINNFLNFIIESVSTQTELSFLPIILIVGALYGLNHFGVIHISEALSNGVTFVCKNPIFIIIPVAILAALYAYNFKILRQKLFLDSGLKKVTKAVHTSNMEWTKRFGKMAPFLQLDLKLIWRNKRTKSAVWMLLVGLLYGLFFYPQESYQNSPWLFIFIGVFSTGAFLINFGQFIPAWDSGYYKLLMSQNVKYKSYLESKFTLMSISVIVLFVLGIPYVFFGWKILVAHLAATIYNVGINTHVILYGGSFNRKKIDLSQKAAFNYQGTGAVQWLIGIPLMLIPMGIFAAFYFLVNFEMACLVLIILGVLGIAFHQKIMKFITARYVATKYKMINAFDQND